MGFSAVICVVDVGNQQPISWFECQPVPLQRGSVTFERTSPSQRFGGWRDKCGNRMFQAVPRALNIKCKESTSTSNSSVNGHLRVCPFFGSECSNRVNALVLYGDTHCSPIPISRQFRQSLSAKMCPLSLFTDSGYVTPFQSAYGVGLLIVQRLLRCDNHRCAKHRILQTATLGAEDRRGFKATRIAFIC
jgi:hypothetical protein